MVGGIETNNNINWNHVFYFSQVVALGSIKAAASHLGLSPSTLSEHIAQLEQDLKVKLFRRHNRRLSLTPEGSRLFQHTKHLIETGARIRNFLSDDKDPGCYSANVAVVPSPSVVTVYKVVGDYLEHCGPINMTFFEVKHEELERGLVSGKYDFGFSNRMPTRKDMNHKLLGLSNLNLYVSEQHVGKKPEELMNLMPVLVCNAEAGAEVLPEYFIKNLTGETVPVVASDYPFVLHKLCKRGLGIGLFTEEFVDHMGGGIMPLTPAKSSFAQDKVYAIWCKETENNGPLRDLKHVLQKLKLG